MSTRWAVALCVLIACGGGGEQPPDARVGLPTLVHVHWHFETSNGDVRPCPGGFDAVEVYGWGPRSGVHLTNEVHACAEGVGDIVLVPMPEEVWGVAVRVFDPVTSVPFGDSMGPDDPPVLPHADGIPEDVNVTVITDIGYVTVPWTVTKAGVPSTCSDVGDPMIQFTASPATGEPVTWTEHCSRARTMRRLPSGPWQLAWTAGTSAGSYGMIVAPTGKLQTTAPAFELAL